MNEWELQLYLDDLWSRGGVLLDHGERLFLVAREVMVPTWDINRATATWNLPSIDFLALDVSARLVAIELKVRIATPSVAWSALCQVTHRAVELTRSFTPLRLDTVWQTSSFAENGTAGTATNTNVLQEHRSFFALRAPRAHVRTEMRRIIAATEFGATFQSVLADFNNRPLAQTLDEIEARYRGRLVRKESDRLRDSMRRPTELSTPVEALRVAIPPSPRPSS